MRFDSVLLGGTGFFGYLDSIAQAMKRGGMTADVLTYPYLRRGWRSWPARLGFPQLRRAYRRRFLHGLLARGRTADVIVLLKGDLLEPEDIEELREALGIPVVLWLIDTLLYMEGGRALSRAADLVLCYSRDDAQWLASKGCRAVFFPLAFDPLLYYPCGGQEKDIDVYFVGNYHSERQVFMEELLVALDGRPWRMVFEGPLYDPKRPLLWTRTRRDYPHLFRAVTNRRVEHAHINALTNRSRICLNVLPAQARSALNVRAYEICGAGGFQVITANEVVGDLFELGREVVAFASIQELVNMLDSYLASSADQVREAIAAAGHRRAMSEHSFDHRVASLMEIV